MSLAGHRRPPRCLLSALTCCRVFSWSSHGTTALSESTWPPVYCFSYPLVPRGQSRVDHYRGPQPPPGGSPPPRRPSRGSRYISRVSIPRCNLSRLRPTTRETLKKRYTYIIYSGLCLASIIYGLTPLK